MSAIADEYHNIEMLKKSKGLKFYTVAYMILSHGKNQLEWLKKVLYIRVELSYSVFLYHDKKRKTKYIDKI